MKQATSSLPRQFKMALALGLALLSAGIVLGQGEIRQSAGVPDDWTHHHLVFSNPGTAEEAIREGTYDRWVSIVSDPRFALQREKRGAAAKAGLAPVLRPSGTEAEAPIAETPIWQQIETGEAHLPRGLMRATPVGDIMPAPRFPILRSRKNAKSSLQTDWSVDLGNNATVGLGMAPAKFSFSLSTANCGNASSPDFVVYNTGVAGSAGQASIVAYDNLYSGCSGTVPSVYWAYDTNGGAIVTSVVLSQDGSQVAFAETTGTAASLVVLKWTASATQTPSAPDVLTATATGSYRACTAPCMTQINFSGGTNDSGSAVYYDYGSDSIYVGDDGGRLHKFTGVFKGTPAEAGSPWPVSVNASGEGLASPVYDSVSGKIFVGDYLVSNSPNCATAGCGFLYSVNASTGAVIQSSRLDYIFGIADAPIVDSSAGRVYAFVGADSGFESSASPCGKRVPCGGVFQFATNFSAGTGGTEARVGAGYEFMLAGTFDNEYFNSSNGSSPTGNLYVVGNTGTANNTLYQIPINANSMGTPNAGPALSTNYTNGFFAGGLQVGEVFTGSKDYIFASVLSFGAPAACTSGLSDGCVMGFDVTTGSISGSTAPTGATTEAQGTSGIIIDNIVTAAPTGASNIYYTPLGNQPCGTGGTGGCAIQISQASP